MVLYSAIYALSNHVICRSSLSPETVPYSHETKPSKRVYSKNISEVFTPTYFLYEFFSRDFRPTQRFKTSPSRIVIMQSLRSSSTSFADSEAQRYSTVLPIEKLFQT
jgi:hypothetical protein